MTKVLIHHVRKNGEHSHGEKILLKDAHQVNPTHGHPSCIQQLCKRNIQPWAQPSEVEWGDPKGEPTKDGPNYTSNVYMLIEVY